MFLVDMCPDPGPLSESSDQMIRFNLFRFLNGKRCSSICPEKPTENSIQMVSAPCFGFAAALCTRDPAGRNHPRSQGLLIK